MITEDEEDFFEAGCLGCEEGQVGGVVDQAADVAGQEEEGGCAGKGEGGVLVAEFEVEVGEDLEARARGGEEVVEFGEEGLHCLGGSGLGRGLRVRGSGWLVVEVCGWWVVVVELLSFEQEVVVGCWLEVVGWPDPSQKQLVGSTAPRFNASFQTTPQHGFPFGSSSRPPQTVNVEGVTTQASRLLPQP